MSVLTIPYTKISRRQLSSDQLDLVVQAEKASDLAHAPYSLFKVGAAVLLENNQIVVGNNQENAAYPSGLCAERVALFSAMAAGNQLIKTLTVVAFDKQQKSADAFCCGACRQVINEYADKQGAEYPIEIIMQTASNDYIILSDAKLLLPFSFGSTSLG